MPRKEIEFCRNIESGYCKCCGCTPSQAMNKRVLPSSVFTGVNQNFENICIAKNGDAMKECNYFERATTTVFQ